MNTFIVFGLFVAVASADVFPADEQHLLLLPDGRISNGEIASPGQFPYQVGLSIDVGRYRSFCGGTLISERYVMTAAHCVDHAESLIAFFGAISIRNIYGNGRQVMFVSKANFVIHKDWNQARFMHDIALIKLPVPVKFNDRIQPAALPKRDDVYSTYEGEIVWASGWGRYGDAVSSISRYLRYIQVPVLKTSICDNYYNSITKNMICIRTIDKKSTCRGDSGGPLVKKDKDKNVVIGITSFGSVLGCEKGWPAVFTRVPSYLDWINRVLNSV